MVHADLKILNKNKYMYVLTNKIVMKRKSWQIFFCVLWWTSEWRRLFKKEKKYRIWTWLYESVADWTVESLLSCPADSCPTFSMPDQKSKMLL